MARWFAGSKIVDATGKPLLLYHGTSKDQDFKTFKVPSNGAWFTTDPAEASQYAIENDSQKSEWDPWSREFKPIHSAARVIPVFVRATNPKHFTVWPDELRYSENYRKAQGALFNQLRQQGHDAVTYGTPISLVIVLGGPEQIKSAIGNKTFDPKKKGLTEDTFTNDDGEPVDLEDYARGYEGACTDIVGPPPNGRASDYEWRYEPNYPMAKFGSSSEWSEWMREEIKMWAEEGQPDRYDDEVANPIREPVIAVEVDGKATLWDGNHRVGGSAIAARPTIPAVIGTAKPHHTKQR